MMNENHTIRCEHLVSVDSTNSELKRRIAQGKLTSAYALSADEQTAGRGRRGRNWFNTDGAVMFSVAFPLSGTESSRFPLVSAAAALGAMDALHRYGVPAAIKWPNDLVTEHDGVLYKLSGILSELAFDPNGRPYAIAGVGINANAAKPPTGLLQPATSIRIDTGTAVNTEEFRLYTVNAVFARLISVIEAPADLLCDYREHLITLGRRVKAVWLDGRTAEGTALRIDDIGRLVIDTADGAITVDAADVSVRS